MFHTQAKNTVTYLTSDALDGVCHGFSTRPGGVSPAPWDSLNLGVGRGDEMENVRENYRRFCAALDRVKDRQHRYYQCPRCHQSVRVPRGKGKIAITCPKCSERFVRKS